MIEISGTVWYRHFEVIVIIWIRYEIRGMAGITYGYCFASAAAVGMAVGAGVGWYVGAAIDLRRLRLLVWLFIGVGGWCCVGTAIDLRWLRLLVRMMLICVGCWYDSWCGC